MKVVPSVSYTVPDDGDVLVDGVLTRQIGDYELARVVLRGVEVVGDSVGRN